MRRPAEKQAARDAELREKISVSFIAPPIERPLERPFERPPKRAVFGLRSNSILSHVSMAYKLAPAKLRLPFSQEYVRICY
jgi:hypothetical protein